MFPLDLGSWAESAVGGSMALALPVGSVVTPREVAAIGHLAAVGSRQHDGRLETVAAFYRTRGYDIRVNAIEAEKRKDD